MIFYSLIKENVTLVGKSKEDDMQHAKYPQVKREKVPSRIMSNVISCYKKEKYDWQIRLSGYSHIEPNRFSRLNQTLIIHFEQIQQCLKTK